MEGSYFTNRTFIINSILIIAFCALIGITVNSCKDSKTVSDYYEIEPIAVHSNGSAFAGSQHCIPCHSDIYDQHIKTAHFNTSAPADSLSIKGSFEAGKNSHILNERVLFTLHATDSGFYQKANFLHNQLELSNLRFDVVFGSGAKGQSYITWEDDRAFQLHTSYFTPADTWTRSPGLKEYLSPRPVVARCFECHATFAKNVNTDGRGNRFDRNQIIFGIDCERCHGPLAKHVGFHQKNPSKEIAAYAIDHSTLTRQQQLDACALCHSGGETNSLQPPFSFLVGNTLDNFLSISASADDPMLDVHGNQYELLTQSSCFKNSETMSCTTCHDPHRNQRGNLDVFNQKCMECHSPSQLNCNAEENTITLKMGDCVSCHMPLFPSTSMVMQVDTVRTAVEVRTHLIDIYPRKPKNKL